jgi:hypothetical protein
VHQLFAGLEAIHVAAITGLLNSFDLVLCGQVERSVGLSSNGAASMRWVWNDVPVKRSGAGDADRVDDG